MGAGTDFSSPDHLAPFTFPAQHISDKGTINFGAKHVTYRSNSPTGRSGASENLVNVKSINTAHGTGNLKSMSRRTAWKPLDWTQVEELPASTASDPQPMAPASPSDSEGFPLSSIPTAHLVDSDSNPSLTKYDSLKEPSLGMVRLENHMGEIVRVFGARLPGPESLQKYTDISDGVVSFVEHPTGDVSAHQWDARHTRWLNIGQYSAVRRKIEGSLASEHLRGQTISSALPPGSLYYFKAVARQRECAEREFGIRRNKHVQTELTDFYRSKVDWTLNDLPASVTGTEKLESLRSHTHSNQYQSLRMHAEIPQSTPQPILNAFGEDPFTNPGNHPLMLAANQAQSSNSSKYPFDFKFPPVPDTKSEFKPDRPNSFEQVSCGIRYVQDDQAIRYNSRNCTVQNGSSTARPDSSTHINPSYCSSKLLGEGAKSNQQLAQSRERGLMMEYLQKVSRASASEQGLSESFLRSTREINSRRHESPSLAKDKPSSLLQAELPVLGEHPEYIQVANISNYSVHPHQFQDFIFHNPESKTCPSAGDPSTKTGLTECQSYAKALPLTTREDTTHRLDQHLPQIAHENICLNVGVEDEGTGQKSLSQLPNTRRETLVLSKPVQHGQTWWDGSDSDMQTSTEVDITSALMLMLRNLLSYQVRPGSSRGPFAIWAVPSEHLIDRSVTGDYSFFSKPLYTPRVVLPVGAERKSGKVCIKGP